MEQRCTASPGLVSASENIARGVYSPDNFDEETGSVTAAAVKMDELLSKGGVTFNCGNSSGLSVFRLDHVGGLEQTSSTIKQIVNTPRKDGKIRNAVGYANIRAKEITEIKGGPLELLDDGSEELTCHSVIRAPKGKTKGEMREARDNLVKMINDNLVRF